MTATACLRLASFFSLFSSLRACGRAVERRRERGREREIHEAALRVGREEEEAEALSCLISSHVKTLHTHTHHTTPNHTRETHTPHDSLGAI